MKILGTVLLISTIVGSCATKSYKEKIDKIKSDVQLVDKANYLPFAQSITESELKKHVEIIASAEFEGRATGSKGQKRAAKYLKDFYIEEAISPAAETYFQTVPSAYVGGNYRDSENVLAYIPGTDKANEYVVVCGHYDHVGVSKKGEIFYGADDNASGTAALLEIAQAFKLASENGNQPRRSVVIMHFTAEEIGLFGSQFYVEHPIFPIENTVVNLNIDMIGRIDDRHLKNDDLNYMYIIGSDKLSYELHFITEGINQAFTKLSLDYRFNADNDHNRFYYRSDHYNFAKRNIPSIFYFNGPHSDYHTPADTPDKINYEVLRQRTQLIFATAWQVANQEQRLKVDQLH